MEMSKLKSSKNNRHRQIQSLMHTFNDLSESEQVILQIKCVIDSYVSNSLLLKYLTKLDIHTPKGIRYQQHTLVPLLAKFEEKKLFVEDRSADIDFSDIAVKLAADSGNLIRIAKVINDVNSSTKTSFQESQLSYISARIAFFSNQPKKFLKLYEEAGKNYYFANFLKKISQCREFIGEIHFEFDFMICINQLKQHIDLVESIDADLDTLIKHCKNNGKEIKPEYRSVVFCHLVYTGRLNDARKLAAGSTAYYDMLNLAWLAYLEGNDDLARKYYSKVKINLNSANLQMSEVFYFAYLLKTDDSSKLTKAMHLISNMEPSGKNDLVLLLNVIGEIIKNRLDPAYNPTFPQTYHEMYYFDRELSPLNLLARELYCAWTNKSLNVTSVYDFSSIFEKMALRESEWVILYQFISP